MSLDRVRTGIADSPSESRVQIRGAPSGPEAGIRDSINVHLPFVIAPDGEADRNRMG